MGFKPCNLWKHLYASGVRAATLNWCPTTMTQLLLTLCALKDKVLCCHIPKVPNLFICCKIQHKCNLNPFYCRLQINHCTMYLICLYKNPNEGYSATAAKQCCFYTRAWNSLSFMSFWNKAPPHVVHWNGTRQCWLTIFSHPTELHEALLPHQSVRFEWGSNKSLPLIQLSEAALNYSLKSNEAVSSHGPRLSYYLLRAQ